MSNELSLRLDLIAAKAKQLAEDHKIHCLWDGDLQRGLREIREQLSLAETNTRSADQSDR